MNRTAYVGLGGGIDLMTPPRQAKPGQCLFAVNYECPVTGGYRRISGYTKLGDTLPGTGPILGVCTFKDEHYAIRKNGATSDLYKLIGGAWASIGTLATGRYEFAEGNFLATEAGRALHMVGGAKPYQLKDGTLSEIAGAMTGAKYIAIHQNHLMLGYPQGSLQHSGIGDPLNWDASTGGAGEIGTSGALTGLINGTGGVLHVTGRDNIKTLYGSSGANFELRTTIPNSGAKPYSLQSLIQPYYVAERGISNLQSAQEFGDFRQMQAGAQIEPLFTDEGYAERVQCSSISKRRAQYRVFFDDGSGVYLSPTGATTVSFLNKPQVMHAGEFDSGEESVLFGDDVGNVYRLGNGAQGFAGEPIRAFLTLAYTDLKQPSVRKRFRRVFWDVRSGSSANITFRPDFDFGGGETAASLRQTLTFLLGGGLWGVGKWGEIAWSAPVVAQEAGDVTGSGTAINFAIYSNGVSEPHELLGYDLTYSERRLRRG